MRLLLDTNVFLWWMEGSERLTEAWRTAIADKRSTVHVSAATIWEISIKQALGRVDLGGSDLVAEIDASGFVELPVTAKHAWRAGTLPTHHNDPFDRMLVAQAELEGLTLATSDEFLSAYGVSMLSG